MKKTVLTGIRPTGLIHVGNFFGAIKPTISLAKENKAFCIIVDYHGLISIQDAEALKDLTYETAAAWLAFGLDHNEAFFYRQSDIPEIFELSWILSCFTVKSLMNKAHAYKTIVSNNLQKGTKDLDVGVSMGLYNYPILMASDILLFDADIVPVGQDQKQHVEIAWEIAKKFNTTYSKQVFKKPLFLNRKESTVVVGLDGRKMSKSYGNVIPLFANPDVLKKLIFKIKTDSSQPHEPKDPNKSYLFSLYKLFASDEDIERMRKNYMEGIGWGDVKSELFSRVNSFLEEPRRRYNELIEDKQSIERILIEGKEKVRILARSKIKQIREIIGIRHIC